MNRSLFNSIFSFGPKLNWANIGFVQSIATFTRKPHVMTKMSRLRFVELIEDSNDSFVHSIFFMEEKYIFVLAIRPLYIPLLWKDFLSFFFMWKQTFGSFIFKQNIHKYNFYYKKISLSHHSCEVSTVHLLITLRSSPIQKFKLIKDRQSHTNHILIKQRSILRITFDD